MASIVVLLGALLSFAVAGTLPVWTPTGGDHATTLWLHLDGPTPGLVATPALAAALAVASANGAVFAWILVDAAPRAARRFGSFVRRSRARDVCLAWSALAFPHLLMRLHVDGRGTSSLTPSGYAMYGVTEMASVPAFPFAAVGELAWRVARGAVLELASMTGEWFVDDASFSVTGVSAAAYALAVVALAAALVLTACAIARTWEALRGWRPSATLL